MKPSIHPPLDLEWDSIGQPPKASEKPPPPPEKSERDKALDRLRERPAYKTKAV